MNKERKKSLNNEFLVLQDRWIVTQAPEDLYTLESSLIPFAQSLIKKELARTGAYYSPEKLEEVAEVATGRLISLMERKRKDGYYVRYFPARLRLDCIKVMYDGSYKHLSEGTITLDDYHISSIYQAPVEFPETPEDLFDFVLNSAHGKQVILILFNALSYPKAILKIDKLVSRDWIYNNAVALKSIYDHTRGNLKPC